MRLDVENHEALVSCLRHHGFRHVMALVEEIVDRISKEVLSVPLPTDPEKASLALYAKRMQAEGANSLRNALIREVMALKSKVEEKENVR